MNDHSQAQADLQALVTVFNEEFRSWEDLHGCGANFRFAYDTQGRKSLGVSDVNSIRKDTPSLETLQNAGAKVAEALAKIEEEEKEPEAPPPPPVKFPELENVTRKMEEDLRKNARTSILQLLASVVGQNDLLLLAALGIDGRAKILDVFIEECQTLKEEFAHGTSRTRDRSGPSS